MFRPADTGQPDEPPEEAAGPGGALPQVVVPDICDESEVVSPPYLFCDTRPVKLEVRGSSCRQKAGGELETLMERCEEDAEAVDGGSITVMEAVLERDEEEMEAMTERGEDEFEASNVIIPKDLGNLSSCCVNFFTQNLFVCSEDNTVCM